MHNCVTPPPKTYQDNKKRREGQQASKGPPALLRQWADSGGSYMGLRGHRGRELNFNENINAKKHHARKRSHARKAGKWQTAQLVTSSAREVQSSATLERVKMISHLSCNHSVLFHTLITVKHRSGLLSHVKPASYSNSISHNHKFQGVLFP